MNPKRYETYKQIRCSQEILDMLRQLADKEMRSESDYIRLLIIREAEKAGIVATKGGE